MEVSVRNFSGVTSYSSFVYMFSSPQSLIPTPDGSTLEWEAVLHPKGVHFPAAQMIGIPSNFDIPEYHEDTVRLSLTCKTALERSCRVNVSILVIAHTLGMEEQSVEYVDSCLTKTCVFEQGRLSHNIDNIVPFSVMTQLPSKYVAGYAGGFFKLLVVIKPTQL
jgi:hypothetical protein